jgi:alkylation response protein AidB-like acyl-CoA dehydrogenase
MDFNDTPQEAQFRLEVRAWLEANARRRTAGERPNRSRLRDDAAIDEAKAWQAKKAAAGYACMTWPKAIGGRGGSSIEQIIYAQEEAHYAVPPDVFAIGLGMCVPTVVKHGSPAHAARFVEPAMTGREIWCQLFSEPAAGSDVAGIRTRAEKDGSDWIINGQKVWTTGAHFADYGLLLARTNPDVAKHSGLTMFFLDMKSKGVEARPIRQISGGAEFNEVFFTDVRIPDSQRLDAEGAGWKVALTTLMNERLAVGMATGILGVDDLMSLARANDAGGAPAIRNGAVREKIAEWFVESEGLKYTRFRTWTALSKGETPGPENSITKVVSARQMQDLSSFAMELMGEGGIMTSDIPGDGAYQTQWLGASGFRIAGGTDEVLRNIIAERVLGLPQEGRADKEGTFRDQLAREVEAKAKVRAKG